MKKGKKKKKTSVSSRQASWKQMFLDFYATDLQNSPVNAWWKLLILKPIYFV